MKLTKILVVTVLWLWITAAQAFAQEVLVRLSFGSGWDALPAIVGIERGFFAQEGVVVSGVAVDSAEAAVTSLVAGSTDVAALPQRTLLLMAAAELPVKVVGTNGWGTQMELVVEAGNESVRSVHDLAGKRIAISTGSDAFATLIRLLNAAELRPQDVTITRLDANNLLKAFENDAADAVFETRYFTSAMTQDGQAKVVLANDEITNTLGTTNLKPLVANVNFVENEPETAQKFINGWVKSLVYIQQDPEDAARLLQIFLHRQGTPVQTGMARSWVGYTHYDRYTWSENDSVDAEYNGWGLKEGQVLKVAPELDGYIDNRFAEKAWERLQ